MRASDALLLARFADRKPLGIHELHVRDAEEGEEVAHIGALRVGRSAGIVLFDRI